MTAYILAIDQGTTSTRAVVYDDRGRPRGAAGRELTQYYPRPGWVEHDPAEIWATVAATVPQALQQAGVAAGQLAAVGLTNQRETTLLWDRGDGRAAAPAVVWQDRRTAELCRQRHNDESWVYGKTGLVIDPYFSATKILWLLDQDPHLRRRAEDGRLAAGTVDSWLLWHLTGGRHLTDVTNASRTLLLDAAAGDWDHELCSYFAVPRALLAEVRPSAGDFGRTSGVGFLPDGLPILGVAGDQQAALFGQCGFAPGDAKCTYGTGAFFLQHTGNQWKPSRHRLLASIAATRAGEPPEYVLEGSVFIAGAAVQWLRDGLKLFDRAPLVEQLAEQSDPDQPILFVPGFVGLGAPHWVPEARGTVFGLTREATAADLGRAALEGVAFQVADLLEAAGDDTGQPLTSLRVDGGMARNAWFLQRQADILGLPVLQATDSEATALGAAYLAGLTAGVWPDRDALRGLARQTTQFDPAWPDEHRRERLARWRRAVQAAIRFYAPDGGS